MGHSAYLAPVGPFAGLSHGARRKIRERFPGLSIVEIESATATFLSELQAPTIEPRLTEARDELNNFAKELERFRGALNQIRRHRPDQAISEMICTVSGENEFEDLERSLDSLRSAIHQTSRALPPGQAEFASRRLVATLASRVEQAGLPLSCTASDTLLSLVDLIFEDLMVGGDASGAVREWHRSQAADIDQHGAGILLDLVT